MFQPPLRILRLYVSPGHNFFGRHGQTPGTHPTLEVSEIHCLTGQGIAGDRFCDFKNNYKGQITFFSQEVYEALCVQLRVQDKTPEVFRRNVLCAGVDLNTLAGAEFSVQGVTFRGCEECRPCAWMDLAFGPGAEKLLKGRGGLRAQILTSGTLRIDGQ